MKKIINILITIILCLSGSSCDKTKTTDFKQPEIITVEVEKKYSKGDFVDFFSSERIVKLETNKESIFSGINRLALYDDKIILLDRKLNSIYFFNSKGRYLNKIKSSGRGPQEYLSLMDFAVDEKEKKIYLYTDRPYKIMTYSLNGEFIDEVKLDNLFFSMSYLDQKLMFVEKNIDKNKMFMEYDLNSNNKKSILDINEKDVFFQALGSSSPNIINSNNVFITFPYSEIVYQYSNMGVIPKYKINFGENVFPDSYISQSNKNYIGINKFVKDNKYGFGISDFRENRNYITFKFWGNMISVYSKSTKKTKTFRVFVNSDSQIPFFNYFAHDGNGDEIISLFKADQFKTQMNIFKQDPDSWSKVPDSVKNIDKNISSNDNPLLIIYTFKN